MGKPHSTSSDDRPVLVVAPAWVGDMVMSQSLYRTLRRMQPDAPIDVLAPGWSGPLLVRMAEVREAIPMPLGHGQLGLGTRYRLGRELRGRGYGRAIVLPISFKAALVPWFAGIAHRTGYRGEMRYGLLNDIRTLDKAALPLNVQRYVALALPAGQVPEPSEIPPPRLTTDPANLERLRRTLELTADDSAVALLPGAAYGPAKQWPPGHFQTLARRLVQEGRQVWIMGGEAERPVGEQIAGMAGRGVQNLCGRTRLEDVVDLLSATGAVVTNDSGLMHVAAAVGTHVIALFGSSTPDYTPPLTTRRTLIYHGLACSPCFQRSCPLGHTRCLTDIGVDEVMAALHSVRTAA